MNVAQLIRILSDMDPDVNVFFLPANGPGQMFPVSNVGVDYVIKDSKVQDTDVILTDYQDPND